jgi:hypothetical protein
MISFALGTDRLTNRQREAFLGRQQNREWLKCWSSVGQRSIAEQFCATVLARGYLAMDFRAVARLSQTCAWLQDVLGIEATGIRRPGLARRDGHLKNQDERKARSKVFSNPQGWAAAVRGLLLDQIMADVSGVPDSLSTLWLGL